MKTIELGWMLLFCIPLFLLTQHIVCKPLAILETISASGLPFMHLKSLSLSGSVTKHTCIDFLLNLVSIFHIAMFYPDITRSSNISTSSWSTNKISLSYWLPWCHYVCTQLHFMQSLPLSMLQVFYFGAIRRTGMEASCTSTPLKQGTT